MADDLEAVGNVLELLGNIVSEVPQLTATIGAVVAARSVPDDLAFQMLRKWLPFRTRRGFLLRRDAFSKGFGFGLHRLMFFKLEFQLLKLDDYLLTLSPKDHVAELLDHELEVLNPFAASAQLICLFRECLAMRIELSFKAPQLFITLRDHGIELLLLRLVERQQCIAIEAV